MTGKNDPTQADSALLRGLTQRRVSRRELFRYGGTAGLAAFLAACGVGGTSKPTQSGKAVDLKKIYGNGKPAGELIWANWPDYIDVNAKGQSPTIQQFEKQTGIDVTYKTKINDNDPFLAANIIPPLQSGQKTGYDMIVITNGGPVERLIKLGFLTPLDHKYIPNFFKYASAGVKNPTYDPGNKYTVAWQSGFTSIGYNSKYVKEMPTSFGDLLNPKYKGKVGLFGNNQDLPCPALVWQGYDIQTSTPSQWKKTAEELMRARDAGIIRSFYDQSYIDALENQETLITQAWSGDIFIAAAPKSYGGDGFPEMKLSLPNEGAVLWTDNMCIPLRAEHPVDAIMMMNFVYQPKIAAQLADFIWYVSPVPAARDVVLHELDDPVVANSPLVFPTQADLAKTHQYKVFKSADEEEEWNSIWEPVYSS